jgi:5-methylcytosine-specific restriction endonuclease McrA
MVMIKGAKPKTVKQEHRGADEHYQTKLWKRTRDRIRLRDRFICQGTLKALGTLKLAGRYAAVDHIIPRKLVNIDEAAKPEGFSDEEFERLKDLVKEQGTEIDENLWLVSKRYHDIKSAKEKQRK